MVVISSPDATILDDARYTALSEARKVVLAENDSDVIYNIRVDAPPAVFWTWLNDADKRNMCAVGDLHWRAGQRPGGRTGVGARNHCAHSKGESTETILDWRPFDYYTAQSLNPSTKGISILSMTRLEAVEGGRATIFHYCFRADMQRLPRWLSRRLCRMMIRMMNVRQNLSRWRARRPRMLSSSRMSPASSQRLLPSSP